MAKYRGVDVDLTPTDGMKKEAERALAWRKEGKPGGTAVGIARARQLKNKQELSASTVRRMFSFFSRHEVDKEAEGFSPGEKGYPSKGRVAWALWGGDSGFSWSRAKVKQLDRIDEEKSVHYEDDEDEDEKAKPISAAVKDGLKRKADEHNDKYGDNPAKRVTYGMLSKVFRRGVGAYHTNPQSVRPNVRSPEQWAYARVNSFLYAVRNGKYRSGKHDTDLLPKGHPMRGPKEEKMDHNEMMGIVSAQVEMVEQNGDYVKIRGMASTTDVDRSGDIMEMSCWSHGGLKDYRTNPIILFNHNYDKPIGKATHIMPTDKGLEIEAQISKADPYIAKLVDDGILSTFSVGFRVKEADVNKETGGLYIKEAELYEISVVSVPANQAAKFEVVKCFSPVEFESYKKGLVVPTIGKKVENTAKGKFEMDEKDMKDLIAKQTSAAVKMALAEKEAADKKAAAEAAEKQAAEEAVRTAAVQAGMSGAERLLEEVKKSFDESRVNTQQEIEALKKALQDRSEEVTALQKSKRQFVAQGTTDWKKAFESDIRDAYLLGVVTQKGWNTRFGQDLIEKVDTQSGVEIPAAQNLATFETLAATTIEKDIQNNLILAPLFREIQMNSKRMAIPLGPDAGYAEFNPTYSNYTGGDGNLEDRDGARSSNNGITLTQKNLEAQTLVSVSFMANDTEEDSVIALLPFLNESMARAHARAIENMLLVGNFADEGGDTATGTPDGLVKIADTLGGTSKVEGHIQASGTISTANLLDLRQNMGKYGTRPQDVIYIVNQEAYYQLLDDAEFQDMNLVGSDLASKVTGVVGNIYGSAVLLCDEFASPANDRYHAVAVNPRNYVMGRLRGVTLESQYVPRLQHRELIATQRLGFTELFAGSGTNRPVVARHYDTDGS
jgi:HK97 family phage prohead protease